MLKCCTLKSEKSHFKGEALVQTIGRSPRLQVCNCILNCGMRYSFQALSITLGGGGGHLSFVPT